MLLGCQTKERIVVQTKIEKIYPGEALLQPCPRTVMIPELRVEDIYTNKDAFERGEGKCADRMDRLIEWYKNNGSSTQ